METEFSNARDMLFLNLIVEADSFNAIESIIVKKINSPYIKVIVADCMRLVPSFNSLELVHI